MRDNTPDGSTLGSRERERPRGRNGYLYVGRDNGEAIYEKDGKLYREKDHQYLVEMSEEEQQTWERKRAEFEVKQDKYMGV